jgi:Bacterial archaeo-eukaryotic release factor family 10
MTLAQDVRRLKERLEGHPGPVLSVYLSVNARYPENQGQAYKVRLKDALEEIEVPGELAGRVRESVEEEVHPGARTLIFFAAAEGLFERYGLQVDLPEAYRLGEPYLAPLVLALDEHEPYGVALFDAERFRFFVSAPIEEPAGGSHAATSGFFKEVDLRPSRPYPRGGMDYEPTSRRTEANVHKWYNELGQLTRQLAFQGGVRHLILAGPKERTADFRDRLPQEIKDRVVAEENIPSEAPEKEFFDRLEAIHEWAENQRKADLIAQAREQGVRGIKDTIEALQEGRVHHLIALWGLEGEIRWCPFDELAITDISANECPFCGGETQIRSLMEVLIDLAAARNARLDFVRAENPVADTPNEDLERGDNRGELADVLRDEFDGLVGLLRYSLVENP